MGVETEQLWVAGTSCSDSPAEPGHSVITVTLKGKLTKERALQVVEMLKGYRVRVDDMQGSDAAIIKYAVLEIEKTAQDTKLRLQDIELAYEKRRAEAYAAALVGYGIRLPLV